MGEATVCGLSKRPSSWLRELAVSGLGAVAVGGGSATGVDVSGGRATPSILAFEDPASNLELRDVGVRDVVAFTFDLGGFCDEDAFDGTAADSWEVVDF